jgi:hypothetical protein
MPECVALFDQMQSMPFGQFERDGPTHLFSLNDYGFYVLLLKVSQHFCRMGEAINRSPAIHDLKSTSPRGDEAKAKAPALESSTRDQHPPEVALDSKREGPKLFVTAMICAYSKELSGAVLLANARCFGVIFGNNGTVIARSEPFRNFRLAQDWADNRARHSGAKSKGDWQAAF